MDGEDDKAPALLLVEPDVLEFMADEDTRSMVVKNGGGEGLSDYGEEPNPNGCRVNLGAFGNTAKATSAANAQHCE